MKDEHANFLKGHVGVFILFCVFIVLLVFGHHGFQLNELKFADFCTAKAGEVLASLLTALTIGARSGIVQRANDRNGNGGNGNGNGATNGTKNSAAEPH